MVKTQIGIILLLSLLFFFFYCYDTYEAKYYKQPEFTGFFLKLWLLIFCVFLLYKNIKVCLIILKDTFRYRRFSFYLTTIIIRSNSFGRTMKKGKKCFTDLCQCRTFYDDLRDQILSSSRT